MNSALTTEVLSYPLSPAAQTELVRLLRTEWTRTDYDWEAAMSGVYSAELAITTMLMRRGGEPVATATVHFARRQPEVAVLGNVLTHRDHRGGGLAGQVIEAAVDHARKAGCAVCLLGTSTKPRNVYLQHGFDWQSGVVMSRTLTEAEFAPSYFAAGQDVQIRSATWGDLPAVTLLATQPLAPRCLDYPRRLLSARHFPLERCLSNFPVLWQETAGRDGLLAVLAGPRTGRVFGFGSATRDTVAGRTSSAVLDAVAHDSYAPHLSRIIDFLLAGCRQRGVRQAEALVAAGDAEKLSCFLSRGFNVAAKTSVVLRAGAAPVEMVQLAVAC